MASIFSRIVTGEFEAYKVAEDDKYLAILDINPLAPGHVLVIPKTEVDYLFDMDDDMYQGLWMFAKKVARSLKRAIPCKRIGVAVIGLEVPHAHVHLVPLQEVGDINFSRSKMNPSKEELKAVLHRIHNFI
jgi:histidine triad (HIT) family protein